jgi:hypothetical protein
MAGPTTKADSENSAVNTTKAMVGAHHVLNRRCRRMSIGTENNRPTT